MLSFSIKIIECIIFCMVTTGAGNFLSIHYGFGQPWIYLVFLFGIFLHSAIKARLRFNCDLIGMLLFFCCFGYLFSFLNEIESIGGLSLYLIPLLGFFIYYLLIIQSDQRIKTISNFLKISLLVLCLSIFIEPFIMFRDFGFLFQGTRLSGLIGNPNIAAFYIIIHLVSIKLLSKGIPNILFIISSLSIIFTFSRSGIMCFILLFLIDSYKHSKLKKILYLTSLILIIMLIINYAQNYEDDYLNKLNYSRLDVFSQSKSLYQDTTRIDIISIYLDKINERPFLGNGAFTGANQKIRAHNTFINIWYEVGILPALAFLNFLVLLFLRSYKNKSHLLVFITCFIFSFFINNLLMHVIFWLLLGSFQRNNSRVISTGYSL